MLRGSMVSFFMAGPERAHRVGVTLVLCALIVLTGCKSDACRDDDYDGYGARCALGPDCDDTNQGRNTDCASVPPPDCEATPTATGCACFAGAFTDCYGGADGTEGVGLCRGGTRVCVNGFYGVCRDEVVPVADVCNDVDDDCDGRSDEAVRSPCGGCNDACTGDTWGVGEYPFVPNAELVLTDEDALELARTATEPSDALWVANSGEDTVSRIDTTLEVEVARHVSGGDDPSRVAVDHRGDVLVTNRAFEGQSTVTKIASDVSRCVDRDMSSSITTSTSPGDVPSLADDECVLWSVDVGAPFAVARALAIDGSYDLMGDDGGDVWVGLFRTGEMVRLDGRDGTELERFTLPIAPFAAAFDPRGILWVLSQDGYLAAIDRRASPPSYTIVTIPFACYSLHGLAIDARGDLLLTGYACNQVLRYVPSTGRFAASETLANPRSVVFLGDEAWVSHTDGRLSEVRMSPLATLRTVDLHALSYAPLDTIGIATDSASMVWAVSAIGGGAGRGLATRIDPVTGAVVAHVPVGLASHVQGDLTGGMLPGVFVPEGATTQVFTGCDGVMTDWRAVHVAADVGAVGAVRIEARWGETSSARANASFVVLGTLPEEGAPFVLPFADGGELELRLVLTTSARDGTPRVSYVGVEYSCSGIIIE